MPTKRKIVRVTDAEDAAINRAAAADPDARELTDAELARMRPAREILPKILGKEKADALMKRRGRPALPEEERKVSVNVRYDRDVIDAFKATGEGWQTRINDALRAYAKSHKMLPR
ncbi:BrnA antitoxin family protein [Cupriavidus taiwanensis]|uniref:BrnA antitoxin family protein n=1 Tax=Cupriavidus taiwanensis TaxID=164546 RepID=UPI001571E726|nr:BrnA antitoxin family protein [Cupriavidus taiwanensis]NSX14616.1 BrnA antitoxin family protein [Cupriavidus taiwanensis]